MSWSQLTTTGSGKVAWRVEIEGYPSCLVSHSQMVQTDSNGRTWLLGLRTDGFEFSEEVDLVSAKAKAGSMRVRFVNRDAGAALFGKQPQSVSYMIANVNEASTTMTVSSSAPFATSGAVYVDTETIKYTGKTTSPDTLTGLSRGQWGSLAQYHYTGDGERLRYPEVTDHPVILEGRRVNFYAYGAGDDPTGNGGNGGAPVWRGIASTDVSFNGLEWSFQVDSIYKILDQDIGADLKDPSPIRGIYYPGSAPLVIEMVERTGAAYDSSPSITGYVAIAGFWESQEDFLVALQTEIDDELTRASFTQTDVRCAADGETWRLEFTTPSSGQLFMSLKAYSAVDAIISELPENRDNPEERAVATVGASYTYAYRQSHSGLGTVPRATLGYYAPSLDLASVLLDAQQTNVDTATNPAYRLYVGGLASVASSTTYASLEWESTGVGDDGYSGPISGTVLGVDATNRYLNLARIPFATAGGDRGRGIRREHAASTAASIPMIRMGRDYGVGTLNEFISTIRGETQQYLNTGSVPSIGPSDSWDINLSASELTRAANGYTVARRTYSVFTEISLSELIEHECRLLGVYPALDSNGRITFRQLRLPSPGEVNDSTITATIAITDDQILSWERGALGLYNTVLYRTGYDPIEDEHKGDVYKVRDVAAFGTSPNARVLEVAPKTTGPVVYQDYLRLAQKVLGVFGSSYAYLTIEVPFSRFGVTVGDIVSVTWDRVPDSGGTIGVSDKLGIVVGRKWSPSEAKGQLTLLMTDQRVGGYVPAAKISSIDSGTSGTQGPFTVTISNAYYPSAANAANLWSAGDLIRLYQWDSTTTTNNVLGDIVSASGTTVVFNTTTNWTHTGATWAIGSQVSTSITAAGQKSYVYLANEDALLDWSGDTDKPPFGFAP